MWRKCGFNKNELYSLVESSLTFADISSRMTKLGLALFLTQLILAKRIYVNSFATPNSDFLLGIDGSSIATAHEHICVLEMKAGGGIGGRSQCWGYDGHGKLQSPKDVSLKNMKFLLN